MLKEVKPSEIESVIGTEVGLSDWVKVDQERINKFAEATLDNQFIHVDPEASNASIWFHYCPWVSFFVLGCGYSI